MTTLVAQVPDAVPQPIATQLRAALERAGISARGLAKRLAGLEGRQSRTITAEEKQMWESKRRAVMKILEKPEIIPEQETLTEFEEALDLKGWFTRPTRESVRAARASLEDDVAGLKLLVQDLTKANARLQKRVSVLERTDRRRAEGDTP